MQHSDIGAAEGEEGYGGIAVVGYEIVGGGPVGAETLAISIGESQDTLEDYYEPYLIQCGLIQRTPRGRVVTERAYKQLGLEIKERLEKGGQGTLF